MTKYTLDRIEEDKYVFLEKGNEISQLEIPSNQVTADVSEGGIYEITQDECGYTFEPVIEETKIRKEDVLALIEKMKNK